MSGCSIRNLVQRAERLFEDFGFCLTEINSERVFMAGDRYHKITYARGLRGLIIESADSLDEAKKNRYEDSDIYFIDLGEEQIIHNLHNDIIKFYLDTPQNM